MQFVDLFPTFTRQDLEQSAVVLPSSSTDVEQRSRALRVAEEELSHVRLSIFQATTAEVFKCPRDVEGCLPDALRWVRMIKARICKDAYEARRVFGPLEVSCHPVKTLGSP
jgi:hypothetical protein